MMRNLLLTLRFDGTAYHGFQVQKNAITICEVVQNAIERLCGKRSDVKGCSRTDSGVHAFMYCLSFKTECSIPADRIPYALNTFLPDDVAVYDCVEVSDDFHARYSTKSKEYTYLIYNGKHRNPFYQDRAYVYNGMNLDENIMQVAANDLVGTFDFTSFCASGGSVQDKTRTVYYCNVERCDDIISIKICANGFLYNMVRIIVGTLIETSCKKNYNIPDIISSMDRSKAGFTAPAHGLYLSRVIYE